jgi:hypothetical protein
MSIAPQTPMHEDISPICVHIEHLPPLWDNR